MTLSKKILGKNCLFLFVFVLFVSANTAHGATLNLQKGWNLVSPLAVINTDFPKFAFLPFQTEKKYYRYTPDTVNTLFQKIKDYYAGGDDLFYSTTAFWVYAKESSTLDFPLSYYDDDDFDVRVNDGNVKLYKGWNLLNIVPQLADGRAWLGSCAISRLYHWEALSQNWFEWPADGSVEFAEKFREELMEESADAVGSGYAIKVGDDCKMTLYRGGTNAPALPSLPES